MSYEPRYETPNASDSNATVFRTYAKNALRALAEAASMGNNAFGRRVLLSEARECFALARKAGN